MRKIFLGVLAVITIGYSLYTGHYIIQTNKAAVLGKVIKPTQPQELSPKEATSTVIATTNINLLSGTSSDALQNSATSTDKNISIPKGWKLHESDSRYGFSIEYPANYYVYGDYGVCGKGYWVGLYRSESDYYEAIFSVDISPNKTRSAFELSTSSPKNLTDEEKILLTKVAKTIKFNPTIVPEPIRTGRGPCGDSEL